MLTGLTATRPPSLFGLCAFPSNVSFYTTATSIVVMVSRASMYCPYFLYLILVLIVTIIICARVVITRVVSLFELFAVRNDLVLFSDMASLLQVHV